MKLVLNVPTLERLIGGDTEIEVEIRKNIVGEFAKRHLAAVAREVYGDVAKAKETIKDEMLKELGTARIRGFSGERFELSSELKEQIRQSILLAIADEVAFQAKKIWEEGKPEIFAKIKDAYDRAVIDVIYQQAKADILATLCTTGPKKD